METGRLATGRSTVEGWRFGRRASGPILLGHLLPNESSRWFFRSVLKRLCKCPEGRLAFTNAEQGLAVAQTVLRVSGLAVNVLWPVSCATRPSEKLLDNLVASALWPSCWCSFRWRAQQRPRRRQRGLPQISGPRRVHGVFWRQYLCFPTRLPLIFQFIWTLKWPLLAVQ